MSPSHSIFSRARHERFREADVRWRVFECVVETCIETARPGSWSFTKHELNEAGFGNAAREGSRIKPSTLVDLERGKPLEIVRL